VALAEVKKAFLEGDFSRGLALSREKHIAHAVSSSRDLGAEPAAEEGRMVQFAAKLVASPAERDNLPGGGMGEADTVIHIFGGQDLGRKAMVATTMTTRSGRAPLASTSLDEALGLSLGSAEERVRLAPIPLERVSTGVLRPRQQPPWSRATTAPMAGRAYPDMGDFTPQSHSFRDRDKDRELFHSFFHVHRRWEVRRALRGGGEANADALRLLERERRALPPPAFP
jgi:hypothetical protein